MKSKWAKYDYEALDGVVLNHPGVYAIYLDGSLAYIGQGENIGKRIGTHLKLRYSSKIQTPWGDAENVVVKIRKCKRFGEWAMVELRLIRRLHPHGNILGTRNSRMVPSA